MDQSRSIRVLLADDHPLIMTGFAMALSAYHVSVIGQAATPEQAVQKYRELIPDVLVLDVRFGRTMSGLNAAEEVLRQNAHANIVFLSQFDQDTLIKEAYRLGARAFLTKDCSPEQLAIAIKAANQGEIYFLPKVMHRLVHLAIQGDTSPQSLLEHREIATFSLMAQGMTNTEIARRLGLSPKTVSNTSQTVKEKLGVYRAADITRLAVKHGLIDP